MFWFSQANEQPEFRTLLVATSNIQTADSNNQMFHTDVIVDLSEGQIQ